jgi:hypothetical protein
MRIGLPVCAVQGRVARPKDKSNQPPRDELDETVLAWLLDRSQGRN